MSLSSCLKKAGDAILAEDATAILERARVLRGDGVKATAAGKQAVDEQIAAVSKMLEEFTPKPVVPAAKADIQDLGEKIGGARKDLAEPTGGRRSAATAEEDDEDIGPTGWRKAFVAAQNTLGRWFIKNSRKKYGAAIRGMEFATQAEAEAAIPLAAVAQKHRAVSIAGGKYELIRDVTDRKRVKIVDQEFDSREDAMRYMAQHAAEILDRKTGFREDVLAKPDKVRRTGPTVRTGDVDGKAFMDTFGFRGVEFGNWNNQAERQELMNHAYDGLLDLADVLNLPPKALSLHGDIGLAFGARGHGLQGARAHYERNYGVMNLTKMQGAGALAHEWFHALDHYLGRMDIPSRGKRVTNARGDVVYDTKGTDDYASHGKSLVNPGLRTELRAAYDDLMKAMFKKAEAYIADTERAAQFVETQRKSLGRALDLIRVDLSRAVEWKKVKNKPATPEQLAKFDAIAQRFMSGDGLATEWKNFPATGNARKRSMGSYRYTNDDLESLSALLKEVRGHSGFNAERHGTLDRLRAEMTAFAARAKMLADANDGTDKTRMVPTSYAMEAKRIDQGMAKDYWTTEHEMAARAFSAYVEDKLQASGRRSDFLSYGSDNRFYKIENIRPFPEGTEREELAKAFDTFFAEVKTEETDKGVKLYSRGEANNPPFYSALLRAVESAKLDKGAAVQWAGTLNNTPGVKAEEMDWTGLRDWLTEQKGTVTREQVADFVRANQIQVQEVVKGSHSAKNAREFADAALVRLTALGYGADTDPIEGSLNSIYETQNPEQVYIYLDGIWVDQATEENADLPGNVLRAATELGEALDVANHLGEAPASDDVRYGNYVLPGGENYRELLLTLAGNVSKAAGLTVDQMAKLLGYGGWTSSLTAEQQAKVNEAWAAQPYGPGAGPVVGSAQDHYHSSHFSEPNILAHVRLTERTDADGKRVLFVEEIQSDWGQTLRKRSAVRDLRKKDSVRKLADDFFGAKQSASMALDQMDGGVLATIKNDKVLDRVIALLPVDVVNKLGGSEAAAKDFLGKNPVVWSPVPADARSAVAVRILNAARVVFADLRAKLLVGSSAGSDVDLLPTLKASDLGAREIVSFLAPQALYHVNLSNQSLGGDVARLGTKESSSSDLAERNAKALPATDAEFLDTPLLASRGTKLGSDKATGLGGEGRPASIAKALEWHSSIVPASRRVVYRPDATPDMPFSATGSWASLAFKRVLRWAAENGFDRIAWTTGEQQAERYDLSKHIGAIGYKARGTSMWQVSAWKPGTSTKYGAQVLNNDSASAQWIEDNLGKEIAQKIVNGEGRKDGQFTFLEGLDLKVGGEGMRGFYDDMLPKEVGKLVKKWGSKVSVAMVKTANGYNGDRMRIASDGKQYWVQDDMQSWRENGGRMGPKFDSYMEADDRRKAYLSGAQPQNSVDITPAMREAALAGLPLFRARGVDGAFTEGRPTAKKVTEWLSKAIDEVKGAVNVKIHENVNQLRIALNDSDIPENVEGVYITGGDTVHLVADQLPDRETAIRKFVHETFGHLAMERYADMRQAIEMTQRLLAAKSSPLVSGIAAEVDKLQPNLSRRDRAKEVIAMMAERGVRNSIIDKMIAGVRELLRRMGVRLQYTETELRALIAKAARALRTAAATGKGADEFVGDDRQFSEMPGAALYSIASKTSGRAYDWASKYFSWYGAFKNLPDQDVYRIERMLTQGTIERGEKLVRAVYETFSKATLPVQQATYHYLTNAGVAAGTISDPAVRARAVEVKELFNEMGREYVRRGMLAQETIDANKDSYLPRMYLKHLLGEKSITGLGTGKRVSDLGNLKERKDIDRITREIVLGEIKDPAFLAAAGLSRTIRDMALLDLLDTVSKKSGWVLPQTLATWNGRKVSALWLKQEAERLRVQSTYMQPAPAAQAIKMAEDMEFAASVQSIAKGDSIRNYREVPDSPRYGMLRGVMVRKEIYDDLIGAFSIMPDSPDTAQRLIAGLTTASRVFKWMKVVASPQAQVRNGISNTIMLNISGVPMWRVPAYYTRAIQEMQKGGTYATIAEKYGLMSATFSAQELARINTEWTDLQKRLAAQQQHSTSKYAAETAMQIVKELGKKLEDLYGAVEAVGKLTKLMHAIEVEGLSESQAALEANKWLFDYSAVPSSVRRLRNLPLGAPFLSYTYFVLPRIAEAAAKHPLRILPWLMLPTVLTAMTAALFHVERDDIERLENAQPGWMLEAGSNVILPWKDAEGRWQAMDLQYTMPWGGWRSAAMKTSKGEPLAALTGLSFGGGPVSGLLDVAHNYDSFRKKEIYDQGVPGVESGDSIATRLGKSALYLANTMNTPLLTPSGPIAQLWDAAHPTDTGSKMPDASIRTPWQSIASAAGLKISPYIPESIRAQTIGQMKRGESEYMSRMRREMAKPKYSADDRADMLRTAQAEIKRRRQLMMDYAEGSQIAPELATKQVASQ